MMGRRLYPLQRNIIPVTSLPQFSPKGRDNVVGWGDGGVGWEGERERERLWRGVELRHDG